MTWDAPISGFCPRRFGEVRERFAASRRNDGSGAAVCVIVGGEVVVDLWGGFVDLEGAMPWAEDTIVNAFSVGKGLLAILALQAVEAGEVDLDAPIETVWPELVAARCARLSLRDMLAHRAGLPAVRRQLTNDVMYDWDRMCGYLAEQEPYWKPGPTHGYHVNTQGYLVGEVLRRATGLPVQRLLRERLTGPVAADYHFGVEDSQHARISPTHSMGEALTVEEARFAFPPTGDAEHDAMIQHIYFNPPGFSGFTTVNTAQWRRAVIPSTNGHGNARALARVYDAYVRGRAAVGSTLRAEAARTQAKGPDRVLGRESRFGLGFQLPFPGRTLGPGPAAFGHFGHGGSLGMADPTHDLAFGYVANRPGARFQNQQTLALIEAAYAAL